MFALHDRVRRGICVAGFLLLCVTPTVAVLAWAAVWSSPWHVRTEARRIGRQLGMDVELGRVEHLRPGAVRLGDVVLCDCEEPGAVLRCDHLEAEWKTRKDKSGVSRRVLVLRAPAAEFDAERLPALEKLARRMLELRAGNLDFDVWFSAATLSPRSSRPTEPLHDVRGAVQTVEGSTEARFQFHPSNQKTARPVLVGFGRCRQIEPPTDWFAIDTGGAELPCEMIGRVVPAMRSLGAEARFRGYLGATRTPAGWNGEIRPADADDRPCEFLDVELDRLVTDRFPHRLSGKARVAVKWAKFRAGRIECASGGVAAGPGTVSASLLAVAVEHLGLEGPTRPMHENGPVRFDGLALWFDMDEQGITIRQWWPNRKAVMVAGVETLLAPTGRTCPTLGLVRAMAPEASFQVPATQQTGWLLRHLVLPNANPRGTLRVANDGEPNEGQQ